VLAANQRVIAVAASALHSVNPDDGSVDWTFENEFGARFEAQPVLNSDGDLFIGDSSGFFYRLDSSTGEVLAKWNLGPGPVRAAATVPANSPYVLVAVHGVPGVTPAFLHKLPLTEDISDRQWKRPICALNNTADGVVGGVAMLEDRSVLITCQLGLIERYSVVNGLLQWRLDTKGLVQAPAVVLEEQGSLFTIFSNETMTGLVRYSLSGLDEWVRAIPDGMYTNAILNLAGTAVSVITNSGELLTFTASDGSQISSTQLFPDQVEFTTALGQDEDGLTLVPIAETLYVLNATAGQIMASVNASGWIVGAPILVDGEVFLSTRASALEKFASASVLDPLGGAVDGDEPATPAARRLSHTSNTEWPVAAIALTLVFALIAVGLIVGISAVLISRRRSDQEHLSAPST